MNSITRIRDQTSDDEQPPEYEVAIYDEDNEVAHHFQGDEVADVVTMPGDVVQVIDMDGERYDPITNALILAVEGDWKVWYKRGDQTDTAENVAAVWRHPNRASFFQFTDDAMLTNMRQGGAITRVKRTELLGQE